MKTAFVYVPDVDDPEGVLGRFENTRLPQCSNAIFFTPESEPEATVADKVREFRKEIAAYTDANDEPVLVAVDSPCIALLRHIVFDLIEHRLPVVFELDDDQRRLVRLEK